MTIPLNMINWSELTGLDEVGVHQHKPASKEQGVPIYSVLHKKEVQGHTLGGAMGGGVHLEFLKSQLQEALNKPTHGKDRHTLATGRPVEDIEGEEVPMHFKSPGVVLLNNQPIHKIQTRPGMVTIRQHIPKGERVPNPIAGRNPAQTRPSAPFQGAVVLGGDNLRSRIFAEGIRFGAHGMSAIRPRENR